MSLTPRYSAVDKAILVSTGNTLVLCGSTSAFDINTSDMMTINGTPTRDWNQAGSSAVLNILAESTVLYAELIWYSTVASNATGALDMTSIQDNPITLITPTSISLSVTPTHFESYTAVSGSVNRFRSADVTTIIAQYGAGTYAVTKVPTSIPGTGLSDTRAGWMLVVSYRNKAFKPQMLGLEAGIVVATASKPYQGTLTGFATASDPTLLKGSLLLAAANGATLTGSETVSAGPSFANLTVLGNPIGSPHSNPHTAPNNPYNNFFSGQINICDTASSSMGLLDISGSGGNINHDAYVPSQVMNARNKWDMTMLDISNTLVPNQTLLAGQITNSGTSEVELLAIGSQVSAVAPDITVTFSAYDIDNDGEFNAQVGDKIIYYVQVKNSGTVAANNVILTMDTTQYSSMVAGTLTLNNVVVANADITKGVNIGTVDAYGVSTVSFQVIVTSLPPLDPVSGYHLMYSIMKYSYQFVSGISTITNTGVTRTISVIVQAGQMTLVKSVSTLNAQVGDTLVYTSVLTNTGTGTASNIFFQDAIDSSCSFVARSVTIDGVVSVDLNPVTGFSLPDLAVGASKTIGFSVTVNKLPPSTIIENASNVSFGYLYNQYLNLIEKNVFSNKTSVQVTYVEVIAERSNDNNYPNVGDKVTYTLALTNGGNLAANNVQVAEPPIAGATFVAGSVKVNGQTQSALNPFTGFNLSSPILPGATTNVSYQMLIQQVQPGQTIDNIAQVPFKYQITPSQGVISTEKDSNTVETRANFVCMNITEKVDKAYATVGDILYYTVDISNTGNINAFNTTFASQIQLDTSFIPNTVAINGVIKTGYNPNQGFTIGTVYPTDTVQVTYQARVINVPTPNIVYNQSDLVYSYLPDPNGTSITNTMPSNRVQTVINVATYTVTKTVNKQYAVVGDSLVYTTTIQNTGTVTLTNVSFVDNLSSDLQFYTGTVYINGVNYASYDPNASFNIGDLHPGDTAVIVFGVTVMKAPKYGYVLNTSLATMSYQVNPTTPVITTTVKSNEVTTYIVNGNVTITKSADKTYAKVGDVITYSFNVANTGNVPVTSVNFIDTVPTAGSFVGESVIVNGMTKPSYNPNQGFPIGNLNMGQVVTISFTVTVNSVPSPNVMINNASATYSFTIDPTQQPQTLTATSNNVTTTINKGDATLTKSVDKAYATVGDILNYTITAKNTGTVTLSSVMLTDLVPTGATFVASSVIVNGVAQTSFNPNTGFNIGDIVAQGTTVVSFQVRVTSVPTPSQITNTATINYQYKIDPSGSYTSDTRTSNQATTQINQVMVTNAKSVDKAYATVGDTLTYTSIITNTGNVNLNSTNFIDKVPGYTTFVAGSVRINGTVYNSYDPNQGFTIGTVQPNTPVTVVFQVTVSTFPPSGYVTNTSNLYYSYNVNPSYNPNTGFPLSDIAVGSYTTITFAVKVLTIPTDQGKLLNTGSVTYSYYINPTGTPTTVTAPSNTATVIVKDTIVTTTKEVDQSIAKIGDTLNFTINVSNAGNTDVQHVNFKDILDVNISFVTNSVYINGGQVIGADPNTGFALPDITPSGNVEVKFAATIMTKPTNNIIYNYATLTYDYTVGGTVISGSMNTNTTQTYVAVGQLTVTKQVDKVYATVGDTVGYTVVVTNTGSVTASTIRLQDIIQSDATFNAGTVQIDGVPYTSYSPNIGFALGDLVLGASHTITFSVTVSQLPSSGKIDNTATTTFKYKLMPTDVFSDGTATSNKVTTYINLGKLMLTKAVDKLYATIGDTVNYTVTVVNQGNTTCTNIIFIDAIQSNALFTTNSVMINGVSQSGADPNIGFALPDIISQGSVTVTFAVTVKTMPQNYFIYNNATTNYKYTVEAGKTPVSTTATSNTVQTQINVGSLTATKAVSKTYATIGDTVSYTITVVNTGNVTASTINFRDVVPTGLTFTPGTVKINGTSYASYNPYQSFSLDNMPAGTTIVVKFDTTVTSLPSPSLVANTANLTFSYYVNPSGSITTKQISSNTVTTQINVGNMSITKAVDKRYATHGDVLTYSFVITNTGNVDLTGVTFLDNLQSDVTFNTGSVVVGTTPQPTFDPTKGFSLDTIATLATVNVSFTVTVIAQPTRAAVINFATGVFNYLIDPLGQTYTNTIYSNQVYTTIIMPSLMGTTTVDMAYATISDLLNYTVVFKNTGNATLSKLFMADAISNGATFVAGTVFIDGVSYPTYNPVTGFNLPDLVEGNTTMIQFQAKVTALPTPALVTESATATGVYKIDPSGTDYPISATTNTVTTYINVGSLTNTKSVDKLYAKVGDTVIYTSVITNVGNVLASTINFADNLQNELTYVSGTVTINGTLYPSYDPTVGFSLGNLAPNQSVTVVFSTVINALPTPPQVNNASQATFNYYIDPNGTQYTKNVFSNTVTTQVVKAQLNVTKAVDKPIATIGDTLTYTVTIINAGNVVANSTSFQDTPSAGVTFAAGSVTINGVTQPTFDPTVGFSLGDIGIGQVVTVTFGVNVVSVPATNKVTNQATITFKYTVDPKQPQVSQTTYSNTVTTNIALGNLSVTKAVDKSFATGGDLLTYTVTITNIGNINATNVQFLDPTPNNAVFVTGTVTINGVSYPSYNPSAGFMLNTMIPGQIIAVVYQVKVLKLCQ